jgi:hypothetical protein
LYSGCRSSSAFASRDEPSVRGDYQRQAQAGKQKTDDRQNNLAGRERFPEAKGVRPGQVQRNAKNDDCRGAAGSLECDARRFSVVLMAALSALVWSSFYLVAFCGAIILGEDRPDEPGKNLDRAV